MHNDQEGPANAAAAAAATPSARELLRKPTFRTLWLAQAVSWTGDHFTFLALMIIINQMTGSASAIALVTLVMTIPRLVFGMVAGVYVDRLDRQRLMVASDIVRGLLSLCLVLVTMWGEVWPVYLLAFLMSSVGVFFVPARSAVVKTIVSEDELLPANILMQTTLVMTLVFGPALAGFAIGIAGPAPAFVFDAVTFFVSAGLVASMAIPKWAAGRTERRPGEGSLFWREFREGMAFVTGSRVVVGLLVVLTVLSLSLGAVNALFVPLLMNVLHVGAAQLGLADSAQGLGMVAGGLFATALAARLRARWLIAGGLLVVSLGIVAIGLAPSYYVVLVLLASVGLVITPLEATIPALMQKVVPLEKMGRVSGVMNTSQSVATLAAMGLAAALADPLGPRLIFVGAGVVGVVAAAIAVPAIADE